MADPFLKKPPSQIEKNTARRIVENTLNKRTKPVKFTWGGLKNLSLFFDTNPFSKLKTDRLNDIMEGRSKAQEKDYIDFFEDVEKGLYGGVQDLGYAVGDLLTSGVDALASLGGKETRLTEDLTKVYEDNKVKDPETLTGEVTLSLIHI